MKLLKSVFAVCLLATAFKTTNAQSTTTLPATTLWKISGNGLQEASYVYLTTPMCDAKITLSAKVTQVLQQVKGIALESNINSPANASKLPTLVTAQNDPQRIKNILPISSYNQLLSTAKDNYGMNEQLLNQFRPFYINAFLLRGASPCESQTPDRIESVLSDYAKKNNVGYKELFTPEETVAEYDGYQSAYWLQNIMYVFNNADQLRLTLQSKNTLYASENIEGLKKLFITNSYFKTKYTTGIEQPHNEAMLSKIDAIIKGQPTLITIDAGYFLASDASLYNLLIKSGYQLSPVL